MFFTYAGRVVAILSFVAGALKMLTGFLIIGGKLPMEALHRYSNSPTVGALIDKGGLYILLALSIGILAEISFSVRRRG